MRFWSGPAAALMVAQGTRKEVYILSICMLAVNHSRQLPALITHVDHVDVASRGKAVRNQLECMGERVLSVLLLMESPY